MQIQNYNHISIASRQPTAQAPKQLYGTSGNLQFSPAEGGMARIGRLKNVASHIRNLIVDLKFRLGLASPAPRAQSGELEPSRKIKSAIGNLLGKLTAASGHADGFPKIRSQLVQLAGLSRGALGEEQGGLKCLHNILNQSSDADLIALRNGSLGNGLDRWNVLKTIPSDAGHAAGKLWDQIAKAVESRFVKQVVQEPLGEIHELLVGPSIDANKLKEPLLRLGIGLDQYAASKARGTSASSGDDPLHLYLNCLPESALKDLQNLVTPGNLDRGLAALREADELRAHQTLDRLRNTLMENISYQRREAFLNVTRSQS